MAVADDRHRLEVAERQLAFVQSFFPRIDSKVSALFAIMSAQIAVAALNLTAEDLIQWYMGLPLTVFLLAVAAAYVFLYRCAYPHLEGGQSSLVYFAEIAKRREAEFIRDYLAASVPSLAEDITGQIWRNSQIVDCKFKFLKLATQFAMFSLLPWVFVLIASSYSHGRLPLLTGQG
ncbi:Pycsar system effector family protein [Novosphingobium lindaniclasticum]|uniref:Pycsar effector protein domain-containing protein n=1 Tax=Novosphingobium lindaniclasticum LE124 TaxID=1096930 RepID=T0IW05_9SPHN|nr:Pycsar system effector family protein [Novosphingobium lindaniclasticum]EQB13864.1 hypothetical protein L284_13720 [Novosphingobium lindaniclasticum LE124]